MGGWWSHVVEPGFFSSEVVRTAVVAGGVVAAISGVVGVFTVLRGQSFAGHSLGDISATGGSGAFLLGINPLFGFVGMGLIAAGCMEALGVRRERGRDVATGIVLGAALGISALLLYFDTTVHNTTGAAVTVLFGSLFAITTSVVPVVIACSVGLLAVVLVLYRPLLLSSLSDDIAAARGIPVRLMAVLFVLTMAVAVALAATAVGAVLSTALLIGPSATALRITKRPGTAMLAAALIGVVTVWVGCLLAYDSFYWPPVRHGWPVSFFIVALVLVCYVAADLGRRWWNRRVSTRYTPVAP
ncbi:MAG TPA: metal ABC transporter permease [Acidimicrobiales bacterium]